ncbi:hypothetical protein N7452_002288 [Penicillium brevicompactum]|uniref:F-box domain-containing protein n=1 Tax=Penicillium brevicompactum TaxID=5074 RepID=A0A9W9R6X2_PENBR|nr:hypothetical protein N7452_002288 [Penicillium brevicompactum]
MASLSVLHKTLLTPPQKAPKAREKKMSILVLPNTLILELYTYLDPIDQACLSLTCKRFHLLVGSNQHKQFKFPRLLKIKSPRLCVNRPEVPRNQLLLRLETSKWLYCAACLKLHPRKAFSKLSLDPIQRRCRVNAGILDLCPCLSLTAGDRQNIIRILTRSNTHSGLEGILGYLTSRPTPDALTARLNGRLNLERIDLVRTGETAHLTHSCTQRAKFWKTTIDLTIFIEDKELVAQVSYILDSQQPKRRNWLAEPVFGCPHIDITMMAGYLKGEKLCTECKTAFVGTSEPNENPAIIYAQRELGGIADSECQTWFRQSRFTNEAYERYSVYWRDTATMIKERDERRAEVKKQLEPKEPRAQYGRSYTYVSGPYLTRAVSLPTQFGPEEVKRIRALR